MDSERALYGSCGIMVRNCKFDGPADGESALKESSDVVVEDSYFNLRYPFWHVPRMLQGHDHIFRHYLARVRLVGPRP